MIKNEAQLKRAEKRLGKVQALISEYHQKYQGDERDFRVLPLLDEEVELRSDIDEYNKLTSLPFEQAVEYLLSKPMLIDNIGELLSKLRIAAKLTQAELAERLGWEQSNLSRFESENYSSQTVSKIVDYASGLNIRLHMIPSTLEGSIEIHCVQEIANNS